MMPLINIGACVVGIGLGQLVRKQDFWANFHGIGLALAISSAFTLTPFTLITIPIFLFFLLKRRS